MASPSVAEHNRRVSEAAAAEGERQARTRTCPACDAQPDEECVTTPGGYSRQGVSHVRRRSAR